MANGPLVIYYNNWAVDMHICALLTRNQCKVSDTQVTLKAWGPLVPMSQSEIRKTKDTDVHLIG